MRRWHRKRAESRFVPLVMAYAAGAFVAARLAHRIGARTVAIGALLAIPTTLWLSWVVGRWGGSIAAATLALPLVPERQRTRKARSSPFHRQFDWQ
jgi:hypothetical protein